MSVRVSPSKSPVRTSTHWDSLFQDPQALLTNDEPVESATCQEPVTGSRAARSCRPSPLKSPRRTSVQAMVGFQVPQVPNEYDDCRCSPFNPDNTCNWP